MYETAGTAMDSLISILPIAVVVAIIIAITFSMFSHGSEKKERREEENRGETPKPKTDFSPSNKKKYSSDRTLCPCGSGKKYEECCGK